MLALAAADPETFTTIWEDPFAYFWARLAYELVGWCLNPEPLPLGTREILRRYAARMNLVARSRCISKNSRSSSSRWN